MESTALTAAIVTVGSELTDGLGLDTNSQEIARALSGNGYRVVEMVSVADDHATLTAALRRLTSAHTLVIVTGGLGPTHDDITREAASEALGVPLQVDVGLMKELATVSQRHVDATAAEQVFEQARVLEGATVLDTHSGTAPGQVAATPAGRLVLLPGPPREMREMLERVLPESADITRVLGCVGISESDAQLTAQRVLGDIPDIRLTVLATPGSVRVVLVSEGVDAGRLDEVSSAVEKVLGDHCYATDGSSLAETVLAQARRRGRTLATAESCTGGLVGAALTTIPGSSHAYLGGVVAYANEVKRDVLRVAPELLASHGAVSGKVAMAMANGVRECLSADVAVSVTGVAGPDGGTPERPVGLVWFAISDATGSIAVRRNLFGDRDGVRERATVTALDLLRRRLTGLEVI